MDTRQTGIPTSVPRFRHGWKTIGAVGALALALATGGAIWANRGPAVSRPQARVVVRPAFVPPTQRPDRSATDAQLVFVAGSAGVASDFQAGLLHVSDGAESLHARVVTQDDVQEILTVNVWREANGLPVVRVVNLARPTSDP